ncbi:unnamed protein product [Paramecium octaurelia]|uniref:Uncharacterized protein n=1 Tax=Paramecium octaurelia TaxID=43137 RepID=A0A8S1T580_PAROT|nr:unnamed protein product [Paramecium octaurelia]
MITIEQYGYRLCFINDNLFTFQPGNKKYLHVYEINIINQQYSKTNQIDVKSDSNSCNYWFPQQYIKSKCLFVNRNERNVNLIKKNQNGQSYHIIIYSI